MENSSRFTNEALSINTIRWLKFVELNMTLLIRLSDFSNAKPNAKYLGQDYQLQAAAR